ncbi:hypothetical protein GCM10023116_10150 [Kistimonas scapharcae]|uniref:Uncharacterized protein n=1 Tax=Kistimonas scapharcae TaxID=1036133 RepID=A0ABP8UYQ0_9GAMM
MVHNIKTSTINLLVINNPSMTSAEIAHIGKLDIALVAEALMHARRCRFLTNDAPRLCCVTGHYCETWKAA